MLNLCIGIITTITPTTEGETIYFLSVTHSGARTRITGILPLGWYSLKDFRLGSLAAVINGEGITKHGSVLKDAGLKVNVVEVPIEGQTTLHWVFILIDILDRFG